jgi:hypothetical protein
LKLAQGVPEEFAFQPHPQAGMLLINDEVDAAPESSRLRIGLGQAGEPVTQLVVAGAVDDLAIATLTSQESFAHQQVVEGGGRSRSEVHLPIVAAGMHDAL